MSSEKSKRRLPENRAGEKARGLYSRYTAPLQLDTRVKRILFPLLLILLILYCACVVAAQTGYYTDYNKHLMLAMALVSVPCVILLVYVIGKWNGGVALTRGA